MGKQWRQRLYFGGSKITADDDCSHDIKTLAPWKKSYDQLSILKSRDITLLIKVHLVKAMVFPIVMYGCESWTVKKAECWSIDAIELWCWKNSWESLGLQGDQTSQSYRKPVLKIHWKDWCWSCNSNTLATWCEKLTHWERPWCWERLKVGGEGDNRGWDGWMASLTWWTWVWASSGSWWWTGKPDVLQYMGSQRVGHIWGTELIQVWGKHLNQMSVKVKSESHSVVSNSFWPHGLYSPWNSPGQNTGVGSLSLLQGIFPTQGSNPGLLHCRRILYQLSHKGSPNQISGSSKNSSVTCIISHKESVIPGEQVWVSHLRNTLLMESV